MGVTCINLLVLCVHDAIKMVFSVMAAEDVLGAYVLWWTRSKACARKLLKPESMAGQVAIEIAEQKQGDC